MRISFNTVMLLAGLGDLDAKCLTRNPAIRWTYTSRRGQIMASHEMRMRKVHTLIMPVPPMYSEG